MFATTEHFNLQTARSVTVSEANGRASTSLAIPLVAGALVGAVVFVLHERHHRRVRDAYRPEVVDRAAIFVAAASDAP